MTTEPVIENMIQGETLAAPEGQTPSSEVVKAIMLKAAQSAITDMLDAGEINSDGAAQLNGEIIKSLGVFGEGMLFGYVSKSLDYGNVTTDSAKLAGGAAATRSGLSDFGKKKMARELYDDTKKGLTPFQKGFQFGPEPAVDVADFLVEEYALGTEDALDVAEGFFAGLPNWVAGF